MEYIYQKSLYQFLKKEEINKIFINKDSKENKEVEVDDEILNFFVQNLKKFVKFQKIKYLEIKKRNLKIFLKN
ncbi:hypothetical protein ACW0S1_02840 [Fusobacterium polymorphum]|uniref:hypothetical protein n=1 Tax=Fusobacterium nucleatum subsp. polymorphum TaxID=76857 RepID=UPI003008F87C